MENALPNPLNRPAILRLPGASPAVQPALRCTLVRERRVTVLVLAAIALGLVDLAFTLTYMLSIGMFEANPLARAMVEIGGARQLVVFKLFTMALSGGLLYLLRRTPAAELVAWLCLAGLLALSAHWTVYTNALATLGGTFDPRIAALDPQWVVITE